MSLYQKLKEENAKNVIYFFFKLSLKNKKNQEGRIKYMQQQMERKISIKVKC